MLLLHRLKKKWQSLKNGKSKDFGYQRVALERSEEDENLANELLETRIVQIFQLQCGSDVPANPDKLFALLNDGSLIPLSS